MRIAVCDDSITDRLIIRELLNRYMSENNIDFIVSEFENGENLIYEICDGTGYDIIFLDMYMEGIHGLDTAKKIRSVGNNSKLVFSTISSEFAVDSYDVNASGYLLKPFSYEKIAKLLDRIIPSEKHDFYRIQIRTSVYQIPFKEIMYAESQNNKCVIHRNDGSEYVVYKKLSLILSEFNRKNFLRCHQSYIVNMDYISKSEKWFELFNGEVIPIRQRSLSEIKKAYIEYLTRETKNEYRGIL